MPEQLRHYEILGTPVAVASYATALEALKRLAEKPKPAAVCASNTHIISLARHDASFGNVMRGFDLVLPDGMPLVWALNRQGAGLTDRVYGPYFMRYALQHLGQPLKHFFFGGKEETLQQMVDVARKLNPDIQIAGTYSPPFCEWTEEHEAVNARRIAASGADFIWVALGGERQERWISRNLHRHQRGVFLAVGDAFELLAGTRPFAPPWLQRRGLTWAYRLWQEPRRLWPRYFKFNSLFLWYALRDTLLGAPRSTRRIAFVGSRGVPARYSGFETVVDEIGARLAANGHEVTVYARPGYYPNKDRLKWHRGMRVVMIPTVMQKSLETILHTFLSVIHATFKHYDVVYFCGVGNAVLLPFPKLLGIRTIINVDGADYRRLKWGRVARWWLKKSEGWAARFADVVIADNQAVVRHYQSTLGFNPTHLSYGAEIRTTPVNAGALGKYKLQAGGYLLHVSRLTPENETHLLLQAYARWAERARADMPPPPLVILGSAGYEHEYWEELQALAVKGVHFLGTVFGDAYVELSQNARFFVLPSAIEATRLVLLDQMGIGRPILFRECEATREVIGDAGMPFGEDATVMNSSVVGIAKARLSPVDDLAAKMAWLWENPAECQLLGTAALARAQERYSWDRVAQRYEEILVERD